MSEIDPLELKIRDGYINIAANVFILSLILPDVGIKNILTFSAHFCSIKIDIGSPKSLNDEADAVFSFNAFIFNKSPLNNKQIYRILLIAHL